MFQKTDKYELTYLTSASMQVTVHDLITSLKVTIHVLLPHTEGYHVDRLSLPTLKVQI